MFLEELNELFRENWSKFLTAGYLVFWKQFPADRCGYLETWYLIFIILIVHITCAAKLTKSKIILVMANYAKNNGPSQEPVVISAQGAIQIM